MRILSLVIALGFVAPIVLSSTAAHAAEELKIGYVDLNSALNQVEDGKSAKARLKGEFEGRQKQLDKMQTELKAKKDEFDSKSSMMKPEIKQAKQDELQREFVKLQQTYVQLQQELMEQEQRVTGEIGEKLRKVIEKVGDREGYTLILNIGDNVLYYKRHKDLTDAVVRDYNTLYGKK